MDIVRLLRGRPIFTIPQPYGYMVFWGRGTAITALYVAAFSYHASHGGRGALTILDWVGCFFALACMTFLVMSIERNDDFKRREEKRAAAFASERGLSSSQSS